MSSQAPVISCKNAWKLFGADPEAHLKTIKPEMSFEDIRAQGYIAGVRDVSIDVLKGEMLVIMGLSGSGKSTLVRCFSRLHDITGGTIEVDGQDIMSLSEKELIDLRRNKMGMVFQSFGLLPHRTVLDNIAFPLEMRGQDRHTRRERALEVIKLVGLEGREDYFPRELSGGQQQRVGIARSLAIEPDIWFLDEPFSALDPLIRREMQDEFLRLQQMLNKTIVFITHDFDEALRLADRIAIMKDGAVEQCDTPDQIVLKPATEYVRKFTEDIDKARVITAGVLAISGKKGTGEPVDAKSNVKQLANLLVHDKRKTIPVALDGEIIGAMERADGLTVLLEAD
ncbi:glycine betaine/L-proline ABC transporter ATP-binding protein [Thalassobium sp. R2A62]|jgi:glycine betaine/proline transport system ATP-binding protein|uniref:quaternary amine ABC transporter ATP-binding protein n=1 Tax=Thalassobium sp. R2A62 TaxID=633131 RepID=UPI0001B1D809|nr:glycine betaine/L-proline ABC transporter ATP-binding protein [Thalassobium sp. R2A62]EET49737.1 glycine betaine transport ATP-binding protein opuAA [Thalassobium sp. R2A62]MDG1339555.1 glycine betaine/L-proline ABC transporter ATP-binding protein [Paracoccaceae bacterium]MDG1803062.1 glycine betaine/L-proline ABC transporter ATP-binding protein [Paracoccaceae bacterium]MDG2453930.1 glycine betaine/L-proline ABC transporter ATP-binding protein [Paracoccaceae bacterium]